MLFPKSDSSLCVHTRIDSWCSPKKSVASVFGYPAWVTATKKVDSGKDGIMAGKSLVCTPTLEVSKMFFESHFQSKQLTFPVSQVFYKKIIFLLFWKKNRSCVNGPLKWNE